MSLIPTSFKIGVGNGWIFMSVFLLQMTVILFLNKQGFSLIFQIQPKGNIVRAQCAVPLWFPCENSQMPEKQPFPFSRESKKC